VDQLSSIMVLEHGHELVRQGARPDKLFYLLEGQMALSSTAPDGSNAVVEVVHPPGDVVLASFVLDLPYLQTAYAVQRSRLIAMESEGLREIVARTPQLATGMLGTMSRDYRSLIRQIRDLKVRTAAQRLGAYLLALVPDPTATEASFRLPFEKGLLAARLGCRQENLSRAFAALRELGVETRGARVMLHDIPRLTAYAMPDYLNDPELSKAIPDTLAAAG
jgi:CRP/FNR family transcriptional activator FtrB